MTFSPNCYSLLNDSLKLIKKVHEEPFNGSVTTIKVLWFLLKLAIEALYFRDIHFVTFTESPSSVDCMVPVIGANILISY